MPTIKIGDAEVEISDTLFEALLNGGEQLKRVEDFLKLPAEPSPKRQKKEESPTKWESSLSPTERNPRIFSPATAVAKSPEKSGETTERNSFGSNFSQQSTLQTIAAEVSKSILLRFEIGDDKIKIITNRDQRADTSISGSQGDHVTAYTTLLQTICTVLDGEDVHEAPKMLFDAIKCFFGDANFMELKDKLGQSTLFENKFAGAQDLLFSRELRKGLTKSLTTIQGMKETDIPKGSAQFNSAIQSLTSLDVEKLKDSIKRGNQAMFAQLIVEVGEKFLEKYNELPTAALPKLKSDKDTTSSGQEGNRVKNAMKYLRLLNKVVAFKLALGNLALDKDAKMTLMNEFIEQCENIMKISSPNMSNVGTINKNFKDFLEAAFFGIDTSNINLKGNSNEELLKFLENEMQLNNHINVAQIGKWFNDLFDFKQANIVQATDKENDGQLVYRNSIKKVALKDPEKTLYEVVARHINFMFIAFKHLHDLPPQVKKESIHGFIEKILAISINLKEDNSQGWESYMLSSSFELPRKLAQNDVIDGIKELCPVYKSVAETRIRSSVSKP